MKNSWEHYKFPFHSNWVEIESFSEISEISLKLKISHSFLNFEIANHFNFFKIKNILLIDSNWDGTVFDKTLKKHSNWARNILSKKLFLNLNHSIKNL